MSILKWFVAPARTDRHGFLDTQMTTDDDINSVSISIFTEGDSVLAVFKLRRPFNLKWEIKSNIVHLTVADPGFPKGAPTSEGAPSYYLANFPWKLHRNEDILGRVRVPPAPDRPLH